MRSTIRRAGTSDSDASCCGCVMLFGFLMIIVGAVYPRQAQVIPPVFAIVETAYESRPDKMPSARRRVEELRRAGWSSADSKGWHSNQDGHQFILVYLQTFSTPAERAAFRAKHRAELHKFDNIRDFDWVGDRREEEAPVYLTRLAGVAAVWLLGTGVAYGLIGWIVGYPLGWMAATIGTQDPGSGCLVSLLPGYKPGHQAQRVAAAKSTAAKEARRGEVCLRRMTLAELLEGGGK